MLDVLSRVVLEWVLVENGDDKYCGIDDRLWTILCANNRILNCTVLYMSKLQNAGSNIAALGLRNRVYVCRAYMTTHDSRQVVGSIRIKKEIDKILFFSDFHT